MFTDLFRITQLFVSLVVTLRVAVKKKRVAVNNNGDDNGCCHLLSHE